MQKLYYSISEVGDILGEEQHTLRYWEQRFTQLKPKKNSAGKRIYSTKDIAVMKIVKKLIREEKLSTEGVKKRLETMLANTKDFESIVLEIEHAGSNLASAGKNEKFMQSDSQAFFSKEELTDLRDLLKSIIAVLN